MGAVEGLAAGEGSAVDRGRGADAQGVALAAPYGHVAVEYGPFGIVWLGGAGESAALPGMAR